MNNYYVYIISNWNNKVIYIGVTNNSQYLKEYYEGNRAWNMDVVPMGADSNFDSVYARQVLNDVLGLFPKDIINDKMCNIHRIYFNNT